MYRSQSLRPLSPASEIPGSIWLAPSYLLLWQQFTTEHLRGATRSDSHPLLPSPSGPGGILCGQSQPVCTANLRPHHIGFSKNINAAFFTVVNRISIDLNRTPLVSCRLPMLVTMAILTHLRLIDSLDLRPLRRDCALYNITHLSTNVQRF